MTEPSADQARRLACDRSAAARRRQWARSSHPDEGVEPVALAGRDAWRELRHRPMFWISLALIVFFVAMASSRSCSPTTDPNFADLTKRAAHRRRATPGSATTPRATTSTPAPSTAPAPRSASASWPPSFTADLRRRASGSSPATAAAGSTRVIGRISEIFFAIPLLLGGILFLYTFPNDDRPPRSRSPSARSRSSSRSSPGRRSPG